MIEAFAKAQIKGLSLTTKDRLKYTIAGCKDGCLYDNMGTNYGLYDNNAPDMEFITAEDLNVSRITASKLAKIKVLSDNFFAEFGAHPTTDLDEALDEAQDEVSPLEEEFAEQVDLVANIKKAIKKGKLKKAQKLINTLDNSDVQDEWQDKLSNV